MKGRKSATTHQAMTSPAGSPPSDNDSGSKEQDRFLPIANVSRIMKRSLPANAKISKEAKETVQECVSEFISFITGEASDKCQREKRKTINGDDLLWAMTTLGFDSYVAPLKTYLGRYRETEGEKNSMARQQERQQMAGGEHDGGRSPSEDGSGVVNPAVTDGGYYSAAAASGIGAANGLYGRMTGGGQEDRRPALPGHFHGVQW